MTKELKVAHEGNLAAKAAGWKMQRKVRYEGRNGAPDRWYFRGPPMQLRIIEYKRPGEIPKPIQQREINRLRERGFDVRVIDSVEGARAAFQD